MPYAHHSKLHKYVAYVEYFNKPSALCIRDCHHRKHFFELISKIHYLGMCFLMNMYDIFLKQ